MFQPEETIAFVDALRASRNAVDNIPEALYPPTLEDAFAVQDGVVRHRLVRHGGRTCGYKIACTNPRVMELLNVSGPFPGRLMTHSTFDSGVSLASTDFRLRIIEAEFGFELARDLSPGGNPFTADSIRPYIGTCLPVLEIVDHGYTDFTRVGESALIADNAIHGACVFGEPVTDWLDIDFPTHPVRLEVNGREYTTGSGANVLGNPLSALTWLANHLAARGIVLHAGERVLTGTAGEIYRANAGDAITADFGALGTVSLAFR